MKIFRAGLTAVLLSSCAVLGWCQDSRVSSPLVLESILIDTANPAFDRLRFTLQAPLETGAFLWDQQTGFAAKAIEFFFLGLAIPQDRLWVNLNPNEPSRMIDPVLKDTDLGRVILAADLRLKKDIAGLTNPRMSEAGKKYWDKLFAKAEELGIQDKIPVTTRVWIVPDAAKVHQDENTIQIISSSFKIYLESEYLGSGAKIEDPRQKELAVYADQLLRELIVPVLTQKVNQHGAYAGLRGAYRALLLAREYKNKSSGRADHFLQNSSATALEDAGNDLSLRADQIYREYLRSLKKGEYNFSESKHSQLDFYLNVITRDYFSGGVDLRGMRTENVPEKTAANPEVKLCSAEIYLPKKYNRPLAFVKNKLELKTEEPADLSHMALLENLPGIKYDKFRATALIGRENFSRAVLSNL